MAPVWRWRGWTGWGRALMERARWRGYSELGSAWASRLRVARGGAVRGEPVVDPAGGDRGDGVRGRGVALADGKDPPLRRPHAVGGEAGYGTVAAAAEPGERANEA